jgi:hypothetical protein
MIESVARAARCPCTVICPTHPRRGPKGDSVRDTGPGGMAFPWRSGAAGRGQMAVGVADSVI